MAVNPKPEGYHTVTPYLVVDDAEKQIEFVKQVLDAQEMFRMDGPDGRIAHAEVRIDDSIVMIGTASPTSDGVMPTMLYLYVPDTDATYKRALDAGATTVEEPADQFYGDRRATVRDTNGNQWVFATNIEDVSQDEMTKRVEALGQS